MLLVGLVSKVRLRLPKGSSFISCISSLVSFSKMAWFTNRFLLRRLMRSFFASLCSLRKSVIETDSPASLSLGSAQLVSGTASGFSLTRPLALGPISSTLRSR